MERQREAKFTLTGLTDTLNSTPTESNGDSGGFNSHHSRMKLTKQDWQRYAPKKPDPNYSVKKNQAVIDGTIKKYEARRKKEMDRFNDQLGERTDAVATYLKSDAINSGKPAEKYFGKRVLAQLRGEQIIDKLKMASSPSFNAVNVLKNKPFTDMRKINAKKEQKSRGKKA